MYRYVFSGCIYPTRVGYGFSSDVLKIRLLHPQIGIDGILDLTAKDSSFQAILESEGIFTDSTSPNLETVKNYVADGIRTIVDMYCFARSYSYDVDIETVKEESLKIDKTFSVRGEFNHEPSDEEVQKIFRELAMAMSKPRNSFLHRVLADFRRSIKYPAETAYHCYRIIEGIRIGAFDAGAIQGKSQDEKKKIMDAGWASMHAALNTVKTEYDNMRNAATPVRHSEWPSISYEQRERFMNQARDIVMRYLAYDKKRN